MATVTELWRTTHDTMFHADLNVMKM